jgi:hypothetical protein
MKVEGLMYFHNSKETSVDNFLEMCKNCNFKPSEKAIENAAYAGYEIGIKVQWDLKTGNCEFIGRK